MTMKTLAHRLGRRVDLTIFFGSAGLSLLFVVVLVLFPDLPMVG